MDTLPVGFAMSLAQNPEAMTHFASLTKEEQANLVNYIQSGTTGDDAKQRIETVVQNMSNGITMF